MIVLSAVGMVSCSFIFPAVSSVIGTWVRVWLISRRAAGLGFYAAVCEFVGIRHRSLVFRTFSARVVRPPFVASSFRSLCYFTLNGLFRSRLSMQLANNPVRCRRGGPLDVASSRIPRRFQQRTSSSPPLIFGNDSNCLSFLVANIDYTSEYGKCNTKAKLNLPGGRSLCLAEVSVGTGILFLLPFRGAGSGEVIPSLCGRVSLGKREC